MVIAPFSGYGKTWSFNFSPIYSLIMFVGIGICATAANWQHSKSQSFLTPVSQSIEITGHYLNNYTHFLDNQTLKGKAGYAAITPFITSDKVYLVNRGFTSYQSRDALPAISQISSKISITGQLRIHKKPLLLNDSLQDPLLLRIQYIDHKHFSKLFDSE